MGFLYKDQRCDPPTQDDILCVGRLCQFPNKNPDFDEESVFQKWNFEMETNAEGVNIPKYRILGIHSLKQNGFGFTCMEETNEEVIFVRDRLEDWPRRFLNWEWKKTPVHRKKRPPPTTG